MALIKKMVVSDSADSSELSIPAGTVFSGNIATQSNARINGTVEGNVISENGNILFGISSSITGNIKGKDIAVGGGVRGDISSCGQISILAGAKVFGNVNACALVIEKDAAFEGHAKISAQEKPLLSTSENEGERVKIVRG